MEIAQPLPAGLFGRDCHEFFCARCFDVRHDRLQQHHPSKCADFTGSSGHRHVAAADHGLFRQEFAILYFGLCRYRR